MWLVLEIKLLLTPPSNTEFISMALTHSHLSRTAEISLFFTSTPASSTSPALKQVAA